MRGLGSGPQHFTGGRVLDPANILDPEEQGGPRLNTALSASDDESVSVRGTGEVLASENSSQIVVILVDEHHAIGCIAVFNGEELE